MYLFVPIEDNYHNKARLLEILTNELYSASTALLAAINCYVSVVFNSVVVSCELRDSFLWQKFHVSQLARNFNQVSGFSSQDCTFTRTGWLQVSGWRWRTHFLWRLPAVLITFSSLWLQTRCHAGRTTALSLSRPVSPSPSQNFIAAQFSSCF